MDLSKELTAAILSPFIRDKGRKVVNLFHFANCEESSGHYATITNISRLINKQGGHKSFVCYNCLNVFTSEERLDKHQELCFQFKSQAVRMPKPKYHFGERVPMYFEAIVKGSKNTERKLLDIHKPCGSAFAVLNSSGKVVRKYVYRGRKCVRNFLEKIEKVCRGLKLIQNRSLPMLQLTALEMQQYGNCNICHICGEKITNVNEKVRDHDHQTGLFRGGAHFTCNAYYRPNPRIPILMHNFRNYDCHLLLSSIKKFSDGEVVVIPSNSEKFMSIITDNFYFVDSLLHLNESLNTLTENLANKDEPFESKFSPLVQIFGQSKAELLSRKGFYPYEFMDSWEKFKETSLPDISCFFSNLTGETVGREDYKYAQRVFKKYCKTMGDYHDLYLLTDVLLLASVVESYRKVAMKHYKLDPVYYYSLPGFSWDAALLTTKVELELLEDQEMYNIIDEGLRGGVSMITTRFAEAYNKYMTDYKKVATEDSFLIYIDKTNLYGEGMLASLPVAGFRFEDQSVIENLTAEDICKWDDNSHEGRILVVDLSYPKHLHDISAHNEYPLSPERIAIPKEKLSKYQKEVIENYTDSLAYKIKTKDLYADLESHREDFDFSDYDANHPLFSVENKKVIVKMKDEAGGKILKSFIGVSPKMYSFSGDSVSKCAMKGVRKSVELPAVYSEWSGLLMSDEESLC
ncbi:hypothetical protein Fcan01_16837 [Folsomia candida]|uniref:DNA-directed DNA polymerase n=1 Tax=Folsomia candida TaxID=158441 RepID=A0A226DSR6_FOLCA|nr:hypothetical protein Fcan01_16837 [Folsomia candida]